MVQTGKLPDPPAGAARKGLARRDSEHEWTLLDGPVPAKDALARLLPELRDYDKVVLYDGAFAEWRPHPSGVIVRTGDRTRSKLTLNGMQELRTGDLDDDWAVDADLHVW